MPTKEGLVIDAPFLKNIIVIGFLLKPLVDFLWDSKISLGAHLASPTMIPNLFITLMALSVALRKKDAQSRVFALVTCCFVASIFWNPINLIFSLRYWASFSGVYLILQMNFQRLTSVEKSRYLNLAACVAGIVVLSTLFQIFGLVPYLTKDWLISNIKHIQGDWTNVDFDRTVVSRVSGLYYHPLDLVRVLIWPYLFMVTFLGIDSHSVKLNFNRTLIYAVLFFAMNLIVYLTTHRTTLLLFLFLPSLMLLFLRNFSAKIKFALTTLLPIFIAWAVGTTFLVNRYNVSPYSAFLPGSLIGLGLSKQGSGQTNLDSVKGGLLLSIHANGRGIPNDGFWPVHLKYISSLPLEEKLLGTQTPFPPGREAQPHNLFLDLLERYGILGCCFLLLVLCSWAIKMLLSLWKSETRFGPFNVVAVSVIFIVYNFITEAFNMPTFAWWMFLYIGFASFLLTDASAQALHYLKKSGGHADI